MLSSWIALSHIVLSVQREMGSTCSHFGGGRGDTCFDPTSQSRNDSTMDIYRQARAHSYNNEDFVYLMTKTDYGVVMDVGADYEIYINNCSKFAHWYILLKTKMSQFSPVTMEITDQKLGGLIRYVCVQKYDHEHDAYCGTVRNITM